jgi:hypothetical protein
MCRAAEEVCCLDRCVPLVAPGQGGPFEWIAQTCGGADQFRRTDVLTACSDSSQCAGSSVCCPVAMPGKRGGHDPFRGNGAPELFRVHACTSDPVGDCAEVELCAGASCRAERPGVSIPCGDTHCAGVEPVCHYDGRDPSLIQGTPRLPPACAAADAPRRAPGDFTVACTGPSDCPSGAQCVLFSFASLDSTCLYNLPEMVHADVAPVCRTDLDCASVLPRWRRFAGEESLRSFHTHCRPVVGDPAHRSQCTVPWQPAGR